MSFIRLGLVALSLALATAGTLAQKINTWKGGTPGRETNWNCPKNWNANAVPDAFSDVVIPDVSTSTHAMPVIRSGRFEANALLVRAGAHLTIETGAMLVVHDRIEGVHAANVRGQGLLRLPLLGHDFTTDTIF